MSVSVAIDVEKKKSCMRWFVAALIFTVYTVAAADRANIGMALPFIKKEFAMSNTEAGAIASLFSLAYAIAQIPSGFTFSRFGVRRIFSLAMIATSAFTGLIGTASSAFWLKACRFGLGLAEGPLPLGITSTINNWFPPKEKGTATGIFLAAAKFGPVVVPPLCAAIIATFGWREIFYIFAVPGLILSVIWFKFVTNRPTESSYCSSAEREYIADAEPPAAKQAEARRQMSMKWLDTLIRTREMRPLDTAGAVFRSWNIWGSAIAYFFMVGIVFVLLAWIPSYLITVKKFTVMGMGIVAAAPWVGAVAGNLLGGWFSDKVVDKRRKPNMLITAAATTVMMYLLVNSPNDPNLLAGLLFVTGILLNLGYSAYMVYPMGMTTKKTFPIACAVVNTGGQLGGAAMPLITGMILDAYNWHMVWFFLAASSFLCFLVLLTITEPRETATAAQAS